MQNSSMSDAMMQVREAQRARLASLAPPPVFPAAADTEKEKVLVPFFEDAGTDEFECRFTETRQQEAFESSSDEDGDEADSAVDFISGPSYVAPMLFPPSEQRQFAVPNGTVVEALVCRGFSTNCAKRAALATGNVGDVADRLSEAVAWADAHKDHARVNEPLQWTLDVAAGWLSHPLANSVVAPAVSSDPDPDPDMRCTHDDKEELPDLEDLSQLVSASLSHSPSSVSSSPAGSYVSSSDGDSEDYDGKDEFAASRRVYCSPYDEVVELDSSDDEDSDEGFPSYGDRAQDAARNNLRVKKRLDFEGDVFDPNTAAAAGPQQHRNQRRENSRSPRAGQGAGGQFEAPFGFGYYCADGAAPEVNMSTFVQG